MKLSIIIPFHKGRMFLADCLDSVEEQKLEDFETILILDRVKEDINDLIKRYQDRLNMSVLEINQPLNKRVYSTYLRDENDRVFIPSKELENIEFDNNYSGVAAARNLGIKNAKGEYIYFLDSDDFLYKNSINEMMSHIKNEGITKYDLIYGHYKKTWFSKKVYFTSIVEENLQEEMQSEENNDEVTMDGAFREEVIEETSEELIKLEALQKATKILIKGKKGLAGISVRGLMINRDFIKKNHILFDENLVFYSDLPFVVKLISQLENVTYVREAIYVVRQHNNPVDYPALSQSTSEDKFLEYIEAYKMARGNADSPETLALLDRKFISYATDKYAKKVRRSGDIWRKEYFHIMQECMNQIDKATFKKLGLYKRRLSRAIKKGKIKKLKQIINFNLAQKKLKRIRKNKRLISYYLYFKVFLKKPIKKNLVLFESFFGKSYSDSPKYIYEYLSKNYPDQFEFVWVINKKTKIPFKHKKVKRFTIKYAYYLAVANYCVFNVRQPEWVRKREGNIFLQTWHGTPLKRLVFDQDEVMAASPLYKAQMFRQSRVWDYFVSANKFSTEIFKSAFKFNKKIFEYGYPRNDILYSENKEEIINHIKKKLNIPADKKTILYAPTWRDDEFFGRGQYKFQLKLDLKLMREHLGKDYIVLLRTHYFIANSLDITGVEDFVVNLSTYDDISELYLISDILITDYSSVFFDYANLKRPMIYYTYDLEKYRDMLRGFYFDIEEELPGPIVYTSEEVVEAIENIEHIQEQYAEKYEKFYAKFCSLDDGHASEKISKEVFNLK